MEILKVFDEILKVANLTTIYRCCMWGDYFLKLLFDELILKFFDGDFEGSKSRKEVVVVVFGSMR
jgi:hypothetical protein